MATNAEEQTAKVLWTLIQPPGVPSNRRRAGIACAFCRSRKVKCNRLGDQPCTNCMFENVQCVLMPKRPRHRRGIPATATSQPVAPEDAVSTFTTFQPLSQDPREFQTQPNSRPIEHSPNPPCIEREMASEGSVSTDRDKPSSHDFDDGINWREAAIETVPMPRPLNLSTSPSLNAPSLGSSREDFSSAIPPFLKPPPSYLPDDHLYFLGRKGALSIPEVDLRDALIESYVHYIHPCYPLIDLAALGDAVQGISPQPFSLSVFQAIMFAASSWVDVKLLRKLGYLSRWAAREAFYSKARILYDLDYEEDRMCQVQTLILLSLWWRGPNEPKDGWHWLGLAISLARTIGLHQDASSKALDPKTRALRRCVWWSCTIRDTFASFSSNRVPRISDKDFAVDPLTFDDLRWHEPRDTDRRGITVRSLDLQKQQAAICLHTAAICRIITRVLLAAYHETSTGTIDTLYFDSTPDQGRSDVEPTTLKNIEDAFQAWKISLPSDIGHSSPMVAPPVRHQQAPYVHRALLSILYHVGLIMIHRQRESSLPPNENPRTLVREAAIQVNKIIMDMYAVDLMKDMPPTVISCLFPVSISHILDMRSKDPTLRREGTQRLEECKQALRELADGHLSAEWAVNFLIYIESKVNSQPGPTKALSTFTADASAASNAEESSDQSRMIHGQTQDGDNGHMSTRSLSTAFLGSNHTSHALTPSAESGFGSILPGSTMIDNPGDWISSPNMWFGFPEVRWDIPGME